MCTHEKEKIERETLHRRSGSTPTEEERSREGLNNTPAREAEAKGCWHDVGGIGEGAHGTVGVHTCLGGVRFSEEKSGRVHGVKKKSFRTFVSM